MTHLNLSLYKMGVSIEMTTYAEDVANGANGENESPSTDIVGLTDEVKSW